MKDIQGYEGLYAITEDGQVWSYKYKKFLRPADNGFGYLQVVLMKDGIKKHHRVHRLVCQAYLPNPLGLPQVNHKDEDRKNNKLENLEWCDAKYNSNYGTHKEKIRAANSKPVYCIELDMYFASAKAASQELGIDNGSIGRACKGLQKTAGRYHWVYVEEKQDNLG